MGHDPTSGSDQKVFEISRVGSNRVGSGGFQILTGRVVSGHPYPARSDLTSEV